MRIIDYPSEDPIARWSLRIPFALRFVCIGIRIHPLVEISSFVFLPIHSNFQRGILTLKVDLKY